MAADDEDDDIPAVARPDPAELDYDLDAALSALVCVRAETAPDAFTAAALGTERRGNGVVIGEDGLIVTIGYLVTEAERVWLTTARGAAAPAHVVAYDQGTGLGLVQALGRLGTGTLALGSTADLEPGQAVLVAGGRGGRDALNARLVAKRPFAGYWEYYLDSALFTAPAHPQWGGAACIGPDGSLVGIGSLLVQEVAREGQSLVGNMAVPIDLLPPILDDLLRYGRVDRPPRPWLGLFATDGADGVTVTGLAPGGPAARAGIQEGDVVTALDGDEIDELGDLWRKLWAKGEAGVSVQLALTRDGRPQTRDCLSADRSTFLKQPLLH
ncbi:MAG: S1C family serine protease [Geminicoccaceae bacterium]